MIQPARTNSVAAYIIAGGRSSRMGADKAFLELGGKPLITRAIEVAIQVAPEVTIVGDHRKFAAYGAEIEDVYAGHGPLGGIHAALMDSRSELNLILAVDLPFLTVQFLTYLVMQAQSSSVAVTVPSTDGFFHPLCAVYRKDFGIAAEHALAQGENKIDALFAEVALRVVTETEMAINGFDVSMFRNLNTREEWEQAKQEFAAKSRSRSNSQRRL